MKQKTPGQLIASARFWRLKYQALVARIEPMTQEIESLRRQLARAEGREVVNETLSED